MRALALVIAIAGCKSSPSAPPIVQGRGEPPAGPPPSIKWGDGAFALERLPAIAASGSEIVVPLVDHDNERGNANLRFELRDRTDRQTGTHQVVGVAEGDAMFGPDGPTAELRARIAAGNRWLAETHARLHLLPMTALAVTAPQLTTRATAAAGGVRLSLDRARVKIDRDGTRVLDRQVPESWVEFPDRAQMLRCGYELQLAGAWIDVERRAAVLTLAVASTNQCTTPAARPIVVAW